MTMRLLLTLATVLIATTAAYPQTAIADIPFPFSVGKSVLPAGKYTFDTQGSQGVLRVRSEDWKSAVMILTNRVEPGRQEVGKIVFNRYGDTYFLSRVLYPSGTGRVLWKSPREIELAAHTAAKTEALLAKKK